MSGIESPPLPPVLGSSVSHTKAVAKYTFFKKTKVYQNDRWGRSNIIRPSYKYGLHFYFKYLYNSFCSMVAKNINTFTLSFQREKSFPAALNIMPLNHAHLDLKGEMVKAKQLILYFSTLNKFCVLTLSHQNLKWKTYM